jgi:FKBP12-rapamycin complex-associated protein
MSMVGYLLGLGDRHPSNLMLDRYSGKLLHIDFGDCFEASMHREKFPERVPFRLTRMLVRAMEVSGIEGNFRSTCEGVMAVLRGNKDSVMAMLEAFVHDPLINWRLLNTTAPGENANEYTGAGVMAVSAVHTSSNAPTPAATPGPGDAGSSVASGSDSKETSPHVTPPTSPFEGDGGSGDVPGDGGPKTPPLETVPETKEISGDVPGDAGGDASLRAG